MSDIVELEDAKNHEMGNFLNYSRKCRVFSILLRSNTYFILFFNVL